MGNEKDIDALKTLLEYVEHMTNFDNPMMAEIKNAHQRLTNYVNIYN